MSSVRYSPPFFVGIDLGGTNIKSGVVDNDGRPMSSVSVETHADKGPEVGLDHLVAAANQAVKKSGLDWDRIAAVGLGSPGTMDLAAGMLLDPPNLPGWSNLPIRQRPGGPAQETGDFSERRQRRVLWRILGRRRERRPQPGDVHLGNRDRVRNRGRRHDHRRAPQPRRRVRAHHHRDGKRPALFVRRLWAFGRIRLGDGAGEAGPRSPRRQHQSQSATRSEPRRAHQPGDLARQRTRAMGWLVISCGRPRITSRSPLSRSCTRSTPTLCSSAAE